MEWQPFITADGSATYVHPQLGCSYRSLKGARSESWHVFVQPSGLLQQPPGRSWRVLELGFGTGLNYVLTRQAALEVGVRLDYSALEPAPLAEPCWLWGSPPECLMVPQRWQECQLPEGCYDCLYHDPFGPRHSPDCWTLECFQWARQRLRKGGRLLTYGASGQARRNMRAAGLMVGVYPGAPGKREMTVAALALEDLGQARPWGR